MTTQTFRPIKFRVWNKAKNKWEHGPGHEPNLFGETILFGGFMNVPFEELNDCVALQFTGLTDSNGKEIYEGDLIEMPNTLIYQVCFGEWDHVDLSYTKLHGWYLTNQGWTWELSNEGKIVGNIFENPELLQSCYKN